MDINYDYMNEDYMEYYNQDGEDSIDYSYNDTLEYITLEDGYYET